MSPRYFILAVLDHIDTDPEVKSKFLQDFELSEDELNNMIDGAVDYLIKVTQKP